MSRVYLDANATTPLAPEVLAGIYDALKDAWGNPSSSHPAGRQAKAVIDTARSRVATMLGAQPGDIIFTSGGTEANNMVIFSALQQFSEWKASLPLEDQEREEMLLPHVVTSNIEHDSIRLALSELVKRNAIRLTTLPVTPHGTVSVASLKAALKAHPHATVLVTVMLANNETGILQPVCEIVAAVKEANERSRQAPHPAFPTLVHTDAAQAIGKIPVHVDGLGVDFLTVVGHKFYGPRIGALYVRSLSVATPLHPVFFGGGQERGFRPGTENTGMIAGLGAACLLVTTRIVELHSHMQEMRDYLERKLEDKFTKHRLHFNGKFPNVARLPNTCNVSFLGPGLQGSFVLSHCNTFYASVGAACHSAEATRPSPILLALGIDPSIAVNALRLSVGRETTSAEIDTVVDELYDVVMRLSNASGVAH